MTGLPSGQNTRSGWAGSNLLHAQVNVTPSNILFADFLVNVDNEGRVGLGPLNPVPTTSNMRTREYFGSIKDQKYFGHGVLVEFGYAHNDFSMSQTPQGQSLYMFSPQGNGGNYFVNSTQAAARDQGLIQAYLPQFQFAGSHQLEAGVDADWLHYNADFRRTGYEVLGLDGQLLSETLFPAPATFHTRRYRSVACLLDTWRVSKRLQFTLGIRQDWDRRDQRFRMVSAAGLFLVSVRHRAAPGSPEAIRSRTTPSRWICWDGRWIRPPSPRNTIRTARLPGLQRPPPSRSAMPGWFCLAPPIGPSDADHQLFTHVYSDGEISAPARDGRVRVPQHARSGCAAVAAAFARRESAGIYQLTNLRRDDYDSVRSRFAKPFRTI